MKLEPIIQQAHLMARIFLFLSNKLRYESLL